MLKYIQPESVTRIYYWSSNERAKMNMDPDMEAYAPYSKVHYTEEKWGWYWNEKEDRPRTGYIEFTDDSGLSGFIKETDLLTIVWKCDALYSGWGRRGCDGNGTYDAREPDAFTLDENREVVYLCME